MAARESSKICPKCLEVNDSGATFCIECGAPLSDEPGAEGSDLEVYRDITQANLHRIRGDYRSAVETCLSILRRYPNNGTAHTLLGDIYAEQGELDQSIQWYEMALDLRPESENDRRKLGVASKRKSEHEAASTAKQLGIPESRPRSQQLVFVLAILIAIVGIGSFFLGNALNGKAKSTQKPAIKTPIDVGADEDKNLPSNDSPTSPGEELTSKVEPTPGNWTGTRAEQEVSQVLRTKYSMSDRILAVYEDRRSLTVSVTAAAVAGVDARKTSTEIFSAIFTEYPDYTMVTVKIVDGGRSVFIGDATIAAYRSAIEAGNDPETALTNVWPIGSN